MFANILTSTRLMAPEQKERWRRTGIGSSDIAAICGIHRWKTSLEVYLDKIGKPQEQVHSERIYIGTKMKVVIAQQFSERQGLRTVRRNMIYAHPSYPYLIATIERWVVGDGAGLLCKSVGEYMLHEWDDGRVPDMVALQCQHYMAVTGASHWWIAALIGGNKLRIIRLDRDDEQIRSLIYSAALFWNEHVLPRRPPAVDGSPAAVKLLQNQYPADSVSDACITLPEQAREYVEQYKRAAQDEKAVARRKAEAENHLKQMLGHHQRGRIGSDTVEWKTINSRTGNRESFRRFQIISR